MVAVGEAAWQNCRAVAIDGKRVGVPDDVDGAASSSFKRSGRLAFAVRPGELNYSNAGRTSRHTGSVGAGGPPRAGFYLTSQPRHDDAGSARNLWASAELRPIVDLR